LLYLIADRMAGWPTLLIEAVEFFEQERFGFGLGEGGDGGFRGGLGGGGQGGRLGREELGEIGGEVGGGGVVEEEGDREGALEFGLQAVAEFDGGEGVEAEVGEAEGWVDLRRLYAQNGGDLEGEVVGNVS